MNSRSRNGKSSELMVAGELIRHGLDVYLPLVYNQAIDMIIHQPVGNAIKHYDVQVKSVSGYNRIVGLRDIAAKDDTYILILHYRHLPNKADECLYLLRSQIMQYHKAEYEWGDLIFNKPQREQYMSQSLSILAAKIKEDTLVDVASAT